MPYESSIDVQTQAEARRTAGQMDEAVGILDAGIKQFPREAGLQLRKAEWLRDLGQVEAALQACHQAIRIRPDLAEAQVVLAGLLEMQGRWEKAAAAYAAAIRLRPGDPELLHLKGEMHGRAGQLVSAGAAFREELGLRPHCARAWIDLGEVARLQKNERQAEEHYRRATQVEPGLARGWHALGACIGRQGRLELALPLLEKAVAMDSALFASWIDYSVCLEKLGRQEEALTASRRALALRPNDAERNYHVGQICRQLGRYDEALTATDRALELDPRHAEAHGNRAMLLLLHGRLEEGFREYEWRYSAASFGDVRPSYPGRELWNGLQDLRGRSILIHDEQGSGDAIQFIRYAALLAQRGARVMVHARAPVVRLLGQAAGVSQVVERGTTPPATDFVCSLMSLALACGTSRETIPAAVPYFQVPEEWIAPWRARLGETDRRRRIGLVWAGAAVHKGDRHRSCGLAALAPLADLAVPAAGVPGVRFISLQKGPAAAQRIAGFPVDDLIADAHDFADTAGLISLLDLVVTVDTAVAHLAGALGKPIWMLLPSNPDWRWMLERTDSPWYPTMRLFRRAAGSDWNAVVSRIREELRRDLAFTA